jgi:hypothetical protein
MRRGQQFFGLAIIFAVLLGLGYAALRVAGSRMPACQVCGRAIHNDMRTTAFVGDRQEVFCCPACALSAGAQSHQPVRFDQLSDFTSGKLLRPADAYAVEGSDIVPCVKKEAVVNQYGQTAPAAFDRCSPSILAFASREAAMRFAAAHGGRVDRFLRLTAAGLR